MVPLTNTKSESFCNELCFSLLVFTFFFLVHPKISLSYCQVKSWNVYNCAPISVFLKLHWWSWPLWRFPLSKLINVFYGATSCEELTHWKRPWCWEGLGAGGKGDDRGWDGWMASPIQWKLVWVNSGRWWWTGRPGVLRFMGSQRVGHV